MSNRVRRLGNDHVLEVEGIAAILDGTRTRRYIEHVPNSFHDFLRLARGGTFGNKDQYI